MNDTIQQKIDALIKESVRTTPGASPSDINKLTPKGMELVSNARREARKKFKETGNSEFLKAGRMISDSFGKKRKPAPAFESK